MKQITIRSIPDKVKKTVQKEAETKGASLNKAIITLPSLPQSGII